MHLSPSRGKLRLALLPLQAIKIDAAKAGIPDQRFIRLALEGAVASTITQRAAPRGGRNATISYLCTFVLIRSSIAWANRHRMRDPSKMGTTDEHKCAQTRLLSLTFPRKSSVVGSSFQVRSSSASLEGSTEAPRRTHTRPIGS